MLSPCAQSMSKLVLTPLYVQANLQDYCSHILFPVANSLFNVDAHDTCKSVSFIVLLDFSLSVKAAPHECVIRTGQL